MQFLRHANHLLCNPIIDIRGAIINYIHLPPMQLSHCYFIMLAVIASAQISKI